MKSGVLFWCINIANNRNEYAERPIFPLFLKVLGLNFVLISAVVVRCFVGAEQYHLAHKVQRMRRAAEATVGFIKAKMAGEAGDRGIVGGGVVKYKVT